MSSSTMWRHAALRIRYSTIGYFRATDAVFFNFLFPVIMLAIFTIAFSSTGNIGASGTEPGVGFATYYLPGMLSSGILLSGAQALAIQIAMERSSGVLKRLGGTPLSPVSYFIGKIGMVFVAGILQAALLLLVALVAFRVQLPTDPSRWLTFAWVFVLGLIASAFLGIALSALPRSGNTAAAVIVPPVLILQFISGVYLPFTQLPSWLQDVASIFPLKWMAQAMRSVFLPDYFKQVEVGHDWHLGQVALVLAGWLVVGLLLSRMTFRWIRKDG